MHSNQHVTIVHDGNKHNKSFIELVKRYHDIKLVEIKSLSAEDIKRSLLIIVQVDLKDPENLRPLKEKMSMPERENIPVLFLLDEFNRRQIVQSNILGATDYISYPCPDSNFIEIMGDLINRVVEQAWSKLSPIQENALKVSMKVVENTFSNAAEGMDVAQEDVKDSCDMIIEATSKDGLTDWMNAIRQHHNYTYRHSMMVCGYLTSFGMLLGVKKADLQMLALGGMVHDIGKSKISLNILDKPSKLDPHEWKIMMGHAEHSRIILETNNWHEDIIDIATHHHERLDGEGYPHRQKGRDVSDLARMTAIADVFSGLVDKRSYKPSMSAEKAISIMMEAEGHLDIPLVKAFQAVVLSDEEKTFAYQQ
ncbi:MAG: HD domain-containing protein [Emcibacter sp.]|nr:HD domain-containing protein [Emcibacter sp.]